LEPPATSLPRHLSRSCGNSVLPPFIQITLGGHGGSRGDPLERVGAGALAAPGAEGKLIFLDIGATCCHCGHVLDRTSLADPRVVTMLNEDFVPIRVDTDKRPDINDRYKPGGWPTTAVLLPDGRLLTGATYLPGRARRAARKSAGTSTGGTVNGRTPTCKCGGPRLQASGGGDPRLRTRRGPEDLPLSARRPSRRTIRRTRDLPGPEVSRTGDPRLLRDRVDRRKGIARRGRRWSRVLRRMAESNCSTGGRRILRYATAGTAVPHYEKMLADNANCFRCSPPRTS